MGFFQKIKELSNLKKAIEDETSNFNSNKIENEQQLNEITKQIETSKQLLESLTEQIDNKEQTMNNIREVLKAENESTRSEIIEQAKSEAYKIREEASDDLVSLLSNIGDRKTQLDELSSEHNSLVKETNRYKTQARKFKADIVGLKNFQKKYEHLTYEQIDEQISEAATFLDEDGLINTIINLPLHSDNSKELRKLSTATRKEIDNLLEKYKSRYTTKSNQTIYHLMIIGLQAEMQLLLYNLSYQKIEETKMMVKEVIQKYQIITAEGNKSILPTVTRFIAEIEPLYLELVDIEYRYYVKRQQEKEEQRAIKDQMRQEADERKALEIERKKLDKEESKYLTEMERNEELLSQETDVTKIRQLEDRLKELQAQLENVEEKKEEITRLALGKAGYVYVISNLGSFGENVFKIGMTRRLEPQQRIDELGSASVPFKFDVHAMIFSDNAVGLESTLHQRLSDQRINKVNFRKEFFKADVATLENLVAEIDPTAEFTLSMLAEEYNQTVAIEESLTELQV